MSNNTEKNKIYTIVIVDDHEIFRQGLMILIKKFESLQLIGSFSNGKELENFLQRQIPDIIIMDLNMPVMDGITASRMVKDNYPNIKIIALTMYQDSYTIERAFKAGASAFMTKAITVETFGDALKKVLDNEFFLSPDAAMNFSTSKLAEQKLIYNTIDNGENKGTSLSVRELEIVKLISKGLTSKEIAEKLSLSPRTIETYRFRVMQKLKVKNSTELVQVASEMKLI